ncbi:MAG: N-acetylmuramoyl-L-alanine amidase [Desulfobulbus sp.]
MNSSQEYREAKNFLFRLDLDPVRKKDRRNWQQSADTFKKIHQNYQQDDLIGPSSLYMVTRVYRLMYSQFLQEEDLESAIRYSRMLASRYPGNNLVDDALYAVAGLIPQKNNPANQQRAAALYRQIIQHYPDSDHFELAQAQLAQLNQESKEPGPAVSGEATKTTAAASPSASGISGKPQPRLLPTTSPSSPTRDAASRQGPALLTPPKLWSSAGYTRIVVQAGAPVDYTADLKPKAGSAPVLTLNFQNASIGAGYRTVTPIREGLLQERRTSQAGNNVVRMEFTLTGAANYTVFHLNDPFRVIVDLHGLETSEGALAKTARPDGSAISTPGAAIALPPSSLSAKTEIVRNAGVASPQPRSGDSAKKTTQRRQDSKNALSLAQQLGLGVRKIVLDPGHGGKDPGAIAHGLKEKNVVLDIAKKLATVLEQDYKFEVLLTRSSDVFLPLEARTAIANASKGDLFISIHTNAHRDPSSRGIETYFLNLATDEEAMRVAAMENATSTHHINEMEEILTSLMKNARLDESSQLARFVQNHLCKGPIKGKHRNLGVKQAPFYVLIGAEMPAILTELLFITNPDEARKLGDPLYQNLLAGQIAKGIVAYIEHQRTAALHF